MIPAPGWKAKTMEEKRKMQNRITQRRFSKLTCSPKAGSRKKGSGTVPLHADQEISESRSWSRSGAQTSQGTDGDKPDALMGAAQLDFQGFCSDVGLSSPSDGDAKKGGFSGSGEEAISEDVSVGVARDKVMALHAIPKVDRFHRHPILASAQCRKPPAHSNT
ncbi:hypothetical protein LX36DRAFT_672425 [Colletotrichum falcatum]|nr:hypothetical protein LX36DRAFT_672425 [Colletotrichum falcatum]